MSAVRRLSLVPDTDTPTTEPGSIRVALATRDMTHLDAHFGSAPKFAVYDVSPTGWSFVEALAFADISDETGAHNRGGGDGDDRIAPKVAALAGCHLLFCLAIGGPSAAKVVAARIHPIKVAQATPLDEVLERTRAMLAGSPPPWLRKVLQQAGLGQPKADFEAE